VILALVLGLALLAGGAYTAVYLAAGDRVPVGTSVAGVDIGGHDPTSAEQLLRLGLADRVDAPFTVVINGRSQQVSPSQVGLDVDYVASVGKAGARRSWRPSRLWRYFTDGSTYRPVVTFDQERLAALIRRLDVTDGRTATDGTVVFRHHTFTIRPPRPGLIVDPRAAGTAFWNAYLSDDPSVQLRLSPTAPAIDTAAIHRFVKRFANRAMASPVELHLGQATLHLSPSDYGDLLGARRAGDRLRPAVQAGALLRLARSELAGVRTDKPQPATVALVAGRPRVVNARPGVRFRRGDLASALLHAIAAPHRSARVHATTARASFDDADARRLGIRRQLARYTVRLPRGAHDGQLASVVRRLDGAVLKPGRSLSVRGSLGAATPSGAGGAALATALFNAAWMGGLQVTSHAAPTSYARSSPVGRDASLRDGRDLAFTDDTKYGVLVSAVADAATTTHDGTLTVTLWSTPRWTVTSTGSGRSHIVPAGRHVVPGSSCTPRAGRDGFDVTVTRSFASAGHIDHRSSYTVRYAPLAAVVCRHQHHHDHHHGHHHRHHHESRLSHH
jgi:vancomycin resistance protein YoaR